METITENPNKAAINNGLIIGIISLMMIIMIYYVYPAAMGSMAFGIIIGVISLVIYIVFTLDLRKKVGGYWSFKEAFKGIFLMSFISGLLYTVVNYIFFKFLEPGAWGKISGIISEGYTRFYENMGMDQNTIDTSIEQLLQSYKAMYDPTPLDLLKNFGFGLLIQFVMSLIFAAIFKKNPPVFAETTEE